MTEKNGATSGDLIVPGNPRGNFVIRYQVDKLVLAQAAAAVGEIESAINLAERSTERIKPEINPDRKSKPKH